MIGDNAALVRTQGGGSATVMPEYTVSPLDGLRAALPGADVSYSRGAVVQQGVTELPLAQMTNPVTGGPGLRARFLGADGTELFAEDRRSSALVWFGGNAPIGRSATVQLATLFTPAESGPVRIGFAAVGHGKVYLDGELIVDETAVSEHADLGAALMAPPTAAAEVSLTAGTPVELRFEYDLAGRTGPLADLLWLRFGTEPAAADADALIAAAAAAAARADVALVVVGTNSVVESEGYDRASLALPGRQDDLVRAVAAANPRTVVLVNAGAPVLLPWRDQVAAVLVGYFGGQEFGHAVADVLLGAAEPGGRLPTTWPAAEADVPVLSTTPAGGKLDYAEGIHIGYRAWLRQDAAPAYWFGAGLGYTDIAVTGVSRAGLGQRRGDLRGDRRGRQPRQARRQAGRAGLRGAPGLRRRPPGALAGRLRARARAGRGDRAGPAQRADPAAGLLGGRLAVRTGRVPAPGRHLRRRPADDHEGGAGMTFPNPLIPGFNPDPSVVAVDGAYYLVTSTFEYLPGIPVYRSTDLTDWTHIGNVASRPEQVGVADVPTGGGVWAPTIRYRDGVFYVIVTVAMSPRGCVVFTATDPAGPWSDGTTIDGIGGIDPDLAWDDDGTAYVTFSGLYTSGEQAGQHLGIQQARVDLTAGKALEPPRSLWSGTGLKFPEAPHLYRRGGYWYLIIAEGGTERGHAVSVARGPSPEGPFEGHPANPVLSARSTSRPMQNTGHADLVAVAGRRRRAGPARHAPARHDPVVLAAWTGNVHHPGVLGGRLAAARTRAAGPAGRRSRRPSTSPIRPRLRTRAGWRSARHPRRWRRPWTAGCRSPAGAGLDDPRPQFVGRRQRHLSAAVSATVDASGGAGGLAARYDEDHWFALEARGTAVTARAHLAGLEQTWQATVPGRRRSSCAWR